VGPPRLVSRAHVWFPPHGPPRAAISLIASDLLVVLWQGVLVRRYLFDVGLRSLLAKPLAAGAVALAVALVLLSVAGRLLAGVLAGVAYVAVLLAIRYITLAEWEPLMVPVRRVLVRIRA